MGAIITTFSQKAVSEYGLAALGYSPVRERRPNGQAPMMLRRLSGDGSSSPPRPAVPQPRGQAPPPGCARGVLGGINHASLVGPRDRLEPSRPQR